MAEIWFDVDTALSEVPVNIFPLVDDTDFKSREVAVAYNATGLDLVWNFVTTGGAMSQTAVTPTDTGGAYDWVHIGDGMYTIEIPASGGASINNDTEGFGWFTGVATGILPWRSPIFGFRAAGINNVLIDSAYSATRGLAGTALPDAAADAAGGLPISDAGGLDLDAQKTDVAAILADTGTDGVKVASLANDSITAAALKTDAVDELVDAVWDEAISGHTTATTFGGKNQKVVPSETIGDYKADVSALTNVTLAATQTGVTIPTVTAVTNGVTIAAAQTVATVTDVTNAVKISAGTGAGQLDVTSGVVKANLAQILGTALTETAGQIAAAFKKFFNVATPTGTVNSLPDAVAGANGGLPTTNGTKVNQTVDLTAGQTIEANGGTVTTLTNLPAIPNDWLTAAGLKADAVAKITTGVMGATVEGTYDLTETLRIIAGVLAGKLSGGGTTTLKFRNLGDSLDIVQATVDANGNRSAVTITLE